MSAGFNCHVSSRTRGELEARLHREFMAQLAIAVEVDPNEAEDVL